MKGVLGMKNENMRSNIKEVLSFIAFIVVAMAVVITVRWAMILHYIR